jgi:hypothetical protein
MLRATFFVQPDRAASSLHVDPSEGVDHHADEGAIAQPDERRFVCFRAAGAGRAFSEPSFHENRPAWHQIVDWLRPSREQDAQRDAHAGRWVFASLTLTVIIPT